jgi:hypothetical protein
MVPPSVLFVFSCHMNMAGKGKVLSLEEEERCRAELALALLNFLKQSMFYIF